MRTYRAFISYRQVEPDRTAAEILHRELERYRLPRGLAGTGTRQLGTFYLDKHETVAGSLSASITTALEQSENLIVVCSPRTPESEWIASEVRTFLELQRRGGHSERPLDRVFVVFLSDEPRSALPAPLLEEALRDQQQQAFLRNAHGKTTFDLFGPRVDATSTRTIRRDIRRDAVLRLAAGMIDGCTLDDLIERRQRRRRRTVRSVVAALSLGLLGIAAYFLVTRSDWWQLWMAEHQAPVEDVATESTLYSWDRDAALHRWIEAGMCSGRERAAARGLRAVDEEILHVKVATSIYCLAATSSRGGPSRSAAYGDVRESMRHLPSDAGDATAYGLATDAVVDAIDALAACHASAPELSPLLQLADVRIGAQQRRVDVAWLGNAASDAVSLSAAVRKSGRPEDARRILDRQIGHLASLGAIGPDAEIELLAESVRLAIARRQVAEAGRLWRALVSKAGDFESHLALEWDDLFRDLARARIAAGETRAALTSAAELPRPVERASAGRILLSDLSVGTGAHADDAWRGLLAADPRLDAEVYDLPDGTLDWRDALSRAIPGILGGRPADDLPLPPAGPNRIRVLVLLAERSGSAGLFSSAARELDLLPNGLAKCEERVALAEARGRMGTSALARDQLASAAATPIDDLAQRVLCRTRIAEGADHLGLPSETFWRPAYESARQLNPDHAVFSAAAFGFLRELARSGRHAEADALLTALPPERGWELAAAVAESLDSSQRMREGDEYWMLAIRIVGQTTGYLQRQDNLSVLAQGLAARGDLRRARLMCSACPAGERLKVLAAVVARGAAQHGCGSYPFLSMIEWLKS